MTVLGWMHRKLSQNRNEPNKCVTTGNSYSSLSAWPHPDEPQYYPEPKYSSAHLKQSRTCSKSSNDNRVEEGSLDMSNEFFHGFLTIGTLGSEPSITEPTTPTFGISFGQVFGEETEVTENEVKLLNNQLEKFIEYEVKEEGYESSKRSIRDSVDKLSSKQINGVDTEEHGNMVVCPLQEYLFGSSIELPKTNEEVKGKKKSIGDHLEKTSTAYKQYTGRFEKGEKQDKETHAAHFMKKMLKKLHFSSRPSPTSAGGNAADTDSIKRKLPKVLRRSRKIHPETVKTNSTASHKYEVKDTSYNEGCYAEDVTFKDHENNMFPQTAISKKEIASYRKSPNGLLKSHSNRNKEYWIKTDADYLVLEL